MGAVSRCALANRAHLDSTTIGVGTARPQAAVRKQPAEVGTSRPRPYSSAHGGGSVEMRPGHTGASHHYHHGLGVTPSPPLEERVGERRHSSWNLAGSRRVAAYEPLSLAPSPRKRGEGKLRGHGGSSKMRPSAGGHREPSLPAKAGVPMHESNVSTESSRRFGNSGVTGAIRRGRRMAAPGAGALPKSKLNGGRLGK